MSTCSSHSPRPATGHSLSRLLAFALIVLGLALALPAGALAAAGWNAQLSGTPYVLGAVACANASDAWAVASDSGIGSVIVATHNGGASWYTQYANPALGNCLAGIAFANANDGWAVGLGGIVLHTSDGGAAWKEQFPWVYNCFDAVACANPSDAWAVGLSGIIDATTNGGATWTEQSLPFATTSWLTGVAFANPSDGWTVDDNGDIFGTRDGGATWTALIKGTGEGLCAVACANPSDAWAVGAGGTIRATSDGGDIWSRQSSGTSLSLNGVACANSSDAWAVGDESTILATTNGGATWKAQFWGGNNPVEGNPLTGVAFTNESDGWAVGDMFYVLATSDGGCPVPAITSFTPTSGPVGTSVDLTGRGFTTASTVSFNGVAAWFEVYDDAQLTSSVPSGATSGTISVKTAYGTVTSATDFTVTASTVTPTLTLKLSGLTSGALKLGKRLTAKGSVTPSSLAGSVVTLAVQRKQGGKWRKVKSMACTITASATYSATYKPAKKGSYRLRATIAKTASNTAATTKWLRFKVK